MEQIADLLKHVARRLRLDREQHDVAELGGSPVVDRTLDSEPVGDMRDPLFVPRGGEDGLRGNGSGGEPAADERPSHLARSDQRDAGFTASDSLPVATRRHLLVSLGMNRRAGAPRGRRRFCPTGDYAGYRSRPD